MTATVPTLLTTGAVVTGRQVLRPGWIEVTGMQVTGVGAGEPPREPDLRQARATVVPGFVDTHVHGGGGHSFDSASGEEAVAVVRWHRAHGSTTMVASLTSAPQDELVRRVAMLADLVQDGLLGGIHLEGPWLALGKRGAHDPHALRDPEPREIDEVLRVGRGTIRMVTLAPERPGGQDAVRRLVAAGVRVAIGHTEADYEQTKRAIAAGATVGTHLFNAMPPVHHRRPGPVPALLEDPRVTVEMVADGFHVHPAMLRCVLATAGAQRVALVTDAMSAAGMGDGSYELGGLPVQVRDGVARLPDGTIAGSTATTRRLFDAACHALGETDAALLGAARACSTTPSASLGLEGVGAIEPGRRADLVLVAGHGSMRVMSGGRWVASPTPDVGAGPAQDTGSSSALR